MNRGKTNLPNRLWLARKRLGLRQKQVAMLLNHRTTDQISRYESGKRVPSLSTAFAMEVVYGIPCRLLFPGLFERIEDRIRSGAKRSSTLPAAFVDRLGASRRDDLYCAYRELLRTKPLTEEHSARVRTHVVELTRTLADL